MLHPIAFALDWAIWVLEAILFAYMIISWLEFWQRTSRSAPRIDLSNPVVRWIESTAYSILHPIRRVVQPYQGGFPIDLSFLIAILLLGLIDQWVKTLPF